MRPPIGSNEGDQLAPVEMLLREAAAYEVEEPAPALLTASGVALLLAEETGKRRRTARAQVLALGALLTGAAACSASLVLALNQPATRVSSPPVPAVQIAKQSPAVEFREVAQASTPRVSLPSEISHSMRVPRRRSALAVPRRAPQHAPPTPVAPPPVPVWTEETVEREVTGVLAQAWLIEPNEEGGVELTPALVDLSLDPAAPACEPAGEPEVVSEVPREDNEAR